MTKRQAERLWDAIFGARYGEMAMIERCPEACAALRIAFPLARVGTDCYGVASKEPAESPSNMLLAWAEAMNDSA